VETIDANLATKYNQVLAHRQHSASRTLSTFQGLRVRTSLLFLERQMFVTKLVRDKVICDINGVKGSLEHPLTLPHVSLNSVTVAAAPDRSGTRQHSVATLKHQVNKVFLFLNS